MAILEFIKFCLLYKVQIHIKRKHLFMFYDINKHKQSLFSQKEGYVYHDPYTLNVLLFGLSRIFSAWFQIIIENLSLLFCVYKFKNSL